MGISLASGARGFSGITHQFSSRRLLIWFSRWCGVERLTLMHWEEENKGSIVTFE